jgi:SNF2 family DNA or RNA helicase
MDAVIASLDSGTVAQKQRKAELTLDVAAAQHKVAIVVINYESLWREPFASWAIEAEFDLVILDECHRSRANTGKTAKFCEKLGRTVPYRLGLTGTPLCHCPLDAYGQYRFLDPGIFGTSFSRFRSEFAIMGGFQGHQVLQYRNLDDLAAKMYSIGFRVMSKDVFDLPPFQDVTREFDLDPNDCAMYQEMENDFCVMVKDVLVTADNALVKILRLQELTSGFLEGMPVNDGKKKLLEDVLEDFEKKEPIVIFARFTNDLKNIKEVAQAQGRRYAELSGHAHELSKWQAGEADILGVQIKSGREGVDFTRARYCIYYSLGHSLGDYNQSRKRVDRPGQTREGVYIHLIARDTIDAAVMAALEAKEEIVESVLRQYRERNHDGSRISSVNAGRDCPISGVTGGPDRVGGPVSQAEIGPRQREGLPGQSEGGLQGRL